MDRTTNQRLLQWPLLAGLLVFAAMCLPFWLGRVYTEDDLGEFHLPLRDFYSRQLAAGESFDWMPSLYCGFYVTGEGQLGGYHPLHQLLYRTLPLGVAFNLELLISYPLMALGTYLLLRRVVHRRAAAAFGTLAFTFSGFNLLHFGHPNAIAIVAHIPWLLWSIDLALTTRSVGKRAVAESAVALLTGSQLLLGYPQYVWFSLCCVVAWTLWRAYRTECGRRVVAELVVANLIGVLIGAAQLLPTIDLLISSTRQTIDDTFRNSGSLHPLNLLQWVAPYLFITRVVGQNTHELGCYFGAVPLVLCVWLLMRHKTWGGANRLIIPLLLAALTALLYAFGEFGPIYRLQAYLPIVGKFRFPCRAIVIFELAAAGLAAIALARLIKRPQTMPNSLWLLPIISAIVALFSAMAWPHYVASPWLIAIGPLLVTVATLLIFYAGSGSQMAVTLLTVFTATDLAAYGLSHGVLRHTENLNQYAAAPELPPHPTQGRILAESRNGSPQRVGNRMLLAGFLRADGYAGLEPSRHFDLQATPTLQAAGIEWVKRDHTWQKVDGLPRARIASSNQAALITRDRPGAIDVETQTTANDLLVVAESFHPGWVATMDGQPVPVIRTEGDFIGCRVPNGSHQIMFRFEPASRRWGLLLSFCGLGLTMAWTALRCGRVFHLPSKDFYASSTDQPNAG